jgi:hypothetical protein
LSEAGVLAGMVPLVFGICLNVITVSNFSKKSFLYTYEGLAPMILILISLWSITTFAETFYEQPALMIFAIGPFYSLSCSRIIIATVTKMRFTLV